jgi:hypothetical protein
MKTSLHNNLFNELGIATAIGGELDTEDVNSVDLLFSLLPYTNANVVDAGNQTDGLLLRGEYVRPRSAEDYVIVVSLRNVADFAKLQDPVIKESNDNYDTETDITDDLNKVNISPDWIQGTKDGSIAHYYKLIRYRGTKNSVRVSMRMTAAAEGDMTGVLCNVDYFVLGLTG